MAIKNDFLHRSTNIHILVWTLYMLYETVIVGILFNDFGNPLIYIAHYLIVILFFYLHADFGLPFALKFKKRAFLLVPILLAVELAAYTYAQYIVTFLLAMVDLTTASGKDFNKTFILRNIYRGILFLGYSTGYYFLRNYIIERKKTETLEKDRLEGIIEQQKIEKELVSAQNAFLKAQINPHFLFNSLDFIYHKVNKHSEQAGEAIIKLAQMMRFAIDSNAVGESIYLAEEIEQVQNLLYLYQIRKESDLNVHLAYPDGVNQLRLIPLVLLTLVENIFKHGDITNEQDIAVISLNIANGSLVIQTRNLVHANKVQHSHHTGLDNIEKRLKYAYGEDIVCQAQSIDNHFKVNIVIPIRLLR